jgi:hypothetical protein
MRDEPVLEQSIGLIVGIDFERHLSLFVKFNIIVFDNTGIGMWRGLVNDN